MLFVLIEYNALVETSQTHHRSVHHQYYVKKRRVVEDAATIPIAFERITPQNPLLHIDTSRYEEIDASIQLDLNLDNANDNNNDISIHQSSLATDPEVTSTDRIFGSARKDFGIKAKRFPWIQEEIDYFHHYFSQIEPLLDEDQRQLKYATCLSFIRRESDEVIKYFHEHHVVNSDRLKTGYLKAMESCKPQERVTSLSLDE